MDLMIDIETMGLAPGCAILSIGAVMFDPASQISLIESGQRSLRDANQHMHVRIDLLSCLLVGLRVEDDTVAWWTAQPVEARESLMSGDRMTIQFALGLLNDYVEHCRPERIWANGPHFDLVNLEAAYRACGKRPAWNFRKFRDFRTLFELGCLEERTQCGTAHDALDDAVAQAEDVRRCWGRVMHGRSEQ